MRPQKEFEWKKLWTIGNPPYSKLLDPLAFQDHIDYAITVGGGSLIDVQSFVSNGIIVIFTCKDHFIIFDLYMAAEASPVSDIEGSGAVHENLDRVLRRIPVSAKFIIGGIQVFLETRSHQHTDDQGVAEFHKIKLSRLVCLD